MFVLWFTLFLAGPFIALGLVMLRLAWPWLSIAANLLFFLPQWMLPFLVAVRPSASGTTAAFSGAQQYALSAGLWGSVLIGFVLLAPTYRVRTLVWLAPVVIIAVTVMVNVALVVAGTPVQLDGP